MGKKDKNKFPAVDNSLPVSPYIDPELQKKVLNELTRGFEWYFPSVHSPYGEFIARWYLPNSFKTLLNRRDNHLKKLKNPKETFKDILKNKVKQCEVLLSIIRDKWIEHDLELTDEMKTFIPYSKPDDTKGDNQGFEQRDYEKEGFIRQNRKLRNKVKALRKKERLKLGNISNNELEQIADQTRKKNGKINYTQMGKRLGVSKDTIRSTIQLRNLFHLIDSPS